MTITEFIEVYRLTEQCKLVVRAMIKFVSENGRSPSTGELSLITGYKREKILNLKRKLIKRGIIDVSSSFPALRWIPLVNIEIKKP